MGGQADRRSGAPSPDPAHPHEARPPTTSRQGESTLSRNQPLASTSLLATASGSYHLKNPRTCSHEGIQESTEKNRARHIRESTATTKETEHADGRPFHSRSASVLPDRRPSRRDWLPPGPADRLGTSRIKANPTTTGLTLAMAISQGYSPDPQTEASGSDQETHEVSWLRRKATDTPSRTQGHHFSSSPRLK